MRRKEKYIIAALVLGMCAADFSGSAVLAAQQEAAEENDSYPDMGDSEEEQAYREFLKNGDNFSDVKKLDNVMYAVYDINKDKKKELILRGKTSDEGKYEYFFYKYKDKEVKTIGSMENWQNGGEGEMYYVKKGNGVVVYMRLADHKAYSLYQVKNKIKYNFTIHRQSLDITGKDGKPQREYDYSLTDKNGNLIGKDIKQKDWDEFEDALVEIPFYNVKMTSDSQFSDDQINTLKKSLGVPDEVKVAKFVAGDPWYWEGAGRWIVSIEMYDEDGGFLAGAAIDPDTLELQREIAPYDADRVAQDKAEKNTAGENTEAQISADEISDAIGITDKVKGLQYTGEQAYNLSLQRDENNYSRLQPEMESGILAAFPMDFDGDGEKEIFSVSYDISTQEESGRVLHFLLLKKDEKSWKVVSDQEVATPSEYGGTIDRNCLDGNCVKEEDSVFFRKYNGTYEFFYEEYDEGLIATGQEWFFKGFRLENGELKAIEETSNLYYSGSPIDELWENFEGMFTTLLEKFSSLGFASPKVYFENMTADSNDGVYKILRMVRDTTCSSDVIGQWMSSNSQEQLDGFTCMIEDKTGEIPENAEEFQTDQNSSSGQNSTQGDPSEYLIPDVVSRYISEEEIAGFSLNDIQAAINEMFARHGRVFKTAEIASYFQTKSWYQPDASKTDDQINAEFNDYEKANEKMLEKRRDELSGTQETQAAQQSGNSPFYGIWCYGTKEEGEANFYAESLKASGFDARVFVTTDWSNLNTEKFYVVTAGVYPTESDANASLASVQNVYPDAYVKYSGDFQG